MLEINFCFLRISLNRNLFCFSCYFACAAALPNLLVSDVEGHRLSEHKVEAKPSDTPLGLN